MIDFICFMHTFIMTPSGNKRANYYLPLYQQTNVPDVHSIKG